MKAYSLRLAALSAVPLFGACAADGQGPSGPQVKIQTAALVLGNVTDVDYGLAVYNGDPSFDANGDPTSGADLVWEKLSLTTGDYGNGPGGDLTYIGPCDASVDGNNFIALVINKILVTSGGSLAGGTVLDDQNTSTDNDPDFVNPCPSDDPCVLDFECVENADVGVTFNLSVMRDANQGFFDIAVNFEDVFCSAKFDTCYAATETSPERAIELLFGYPTEGGSLERGHTGVLALACTGGPNANDNTHMYLNPIKISCPDGQGGTTVTTLDPSAGPGNVYPTPGTFDSGTVWQYAVYEGQEQLNCDGLSCDKAYWNVAIGLEGLPANCKLSTEATATSEALEYGQLAANGSYPVIKFNDIVLTGDQGVLCSQNPLGSAGVSTDYKDIGDTASFGNELTQGTGLTVDTHTIEAPPAVPAADIGELGKGGRKDFANDFGGAVQHAWIYFNFLQNAGPYGFSFKCSNNPTATYQVFGPGSSVGSPGSLLGSGTCDGSMFNSMDYLPGSDTFTPYGKYFIYFSANGGVSTSTTLHLNAN